MEGGVRVIEGRFYRKERDELQRKGCRDSLGKPEEEGVCEEDEN